jgi:DNA-binding transcriptional LysR family regulator
MFGDVDALVIFATVVERGGFTAAATALGIPKTTVSRKVALLEERLGTRLLNARHAA